jgi:glycosyltransferase involved in cell wall biosynthesis
MAEQRSWEPGLVSVVLPVHNGEDTLAEAVASVLAQAYRPIEVIIVDDGSTDSTARVVDALQGPVRHFVQGQAGPAAARNTGIRKARGEFIAFIDADDLWPEGKLAGQMQCFDAFPGAEIVQGLIRRVRVAKRSGGAAAADIDFPFVYTNLGAMIVRRSVFDRIGYLEESLRYHEDTDFWLRAREAGVRVLVQRKLALIYRIHGRSLTAGVDLDALGLLKIIRRSLERRRDPAGVVERIPPLSLLHDMLVEGQGPSRPDASDAAAWPLVSIIAFFSDVPASATQLVASLAAQDYPHAEVLLVIPELREAQAPTSEHFQRVEIVEGFADLASGLNAAIQGSRGEMLAFLDADGEWSADKLKVQVRHLLENPDEEYVVARTRQILMPDVRYPADLIDGVAVRTSLGDLLATLVARRSAFRRVGGFVAGLPGMEETDWLLRAKDAGLDRKMLPRVLFHRFVRPDSAYIATRQMKSALLRSVHASVHRKRQARPLHP